MLTAMPMKRKVVKDLLKRGAVSVNGRTVTQFDFPLVPVLKSLSVTSNRQSPQPVWNIHEFSSSTKTTT